MPSGMKKKSVVDHYVYLTPHPIFFHPGPPANAGAAFKNHKEKEDCAKQSSFSFSSLITSVLRSTDVIRDPEREKYLVAHKVFNPL